MHYHHYQRCHIVWPVEVQPTATCAQVQNARAACSTLYRISSWMPCQQWHVRLHVDTASNGLINMLMAEHTASGTSIATKVFFLFLGHQGCQPGPTVAFLILQSRCMPCTRVKYLLPTEHDCYEVVDTCTALMTMVHLLHTNPVAHTPADAGGPAAWAPLHLMYHMICSVCHVP